MFFTLHAGNQTRVVRHCWHFGKETNMTQARLRRSIAAAAAATCGIVALSANDAAARTR